MNHIMSEELNEYLDAIARDERYVVDNTLKDNPYERTELVYFTESDGSKRGPYIRKCIDKDTGLGAIYERIWKAQEQGEHFTYIPRIFDYYEIDSKRIVVMEYVEGETLAEVVYRCDPSVDLAKELFPRLCDAVGELHERFDPPIIHRDLKPSNVLISDTRLAIIDFGIARTFKDESDQDTLHFGTRAYAPPEQFGFGQTDERSDIYALGMLLYFCLTEKTPDQDARNDAFCAEGVPEQLSEVIAHATALDPAQRYASAKELKDAFDKSCNLIDAYESSRPVVTSSMSDSNSRKTSAGEPDSRKLVTDTFNASAGHVKKQHPSRIPKTPIGRVLAKIPFGIGVVWDILLFLILIVFFVQCIMFIISPDSIGYPEVMLRSVPYRVITYIATFLVIAAIEYAICDRRPLIQLFPRLLHVSTAVELVICIVAVIVFGAIISFASALP